MGNRLGSRTRDDGSRTSLRTVDGVARGTRWVVPGWTRTIRLLRGLLPKSEVFSADEGGGDEETRTPDPLLAKEMLYQLSYVPRAR